MELTLSEKAISWFKEEMGLTKGDTLKFFAKIYGSSPVQESYSLGFAKDYPIDIISSIEVDGIIFYVEESDLWILMDMICMSTMMKKRMNWSLNIISQIVNYNRF